MKEKEFIMWMRNNGLINISKHYKNIFKNVLKQCLNIKKEEFLIIGDRGSRNKRLSPIITMGYYLAAKELDLNTKLFIRDNVAMIDIDKKMSRTLSDLGKEKVITMNLSRALGNLGVLGKSFRSYAKKANHKFTSVSNLESLQTNHLKDIIKAMDVDYAKLRQNGLRIKKILDKGKMVHVTTTKGTDLYYNISGKKAVSNDGYYHKQGTGGNMPAGEVYIPPKAKKDIYGKVVVDGSIRTHQGTFLLKHPVTLTIENDEVVNIAGFKEARMLENSLKRAKLKSKYGWGVRRLSELGIGINPNAKIIGVTIVDEKTIGTAHVAIGSNAWFGGTVYAINHYDQVFKKPKIYVDNKLLTV